MFPYSLSSLQKGKMKMDEDDDELILHVAIRFAEGIDKDNMGADADQRTYQVFGWGRPDMEFHTQVVNGKPDPIWMMTFHMWMRDPWMWTHLHLEVVRTGSKSDPGSSSGTVLVGRAQIPLPREIGIAIGGKYNLVRHVKPISVVGCICVAMEITKKE
ncbi:hypothetical protein Acr_24g0011650 [Actinidia rufa]|uniref:C2 domain-containing protein n=1 Tax=Actinidia rufa TaxID=165716 RepID=A0A7J0GVU4_9ERIC|nr:hypothetical protein Acr_24g0011650 [Actinidia rufa]